MDKTLQIPAIAAADVLPLVEAFLEAVPEYSASRLGKQAKKDPTCIFAIRNGREPRSATVRAIAEVIEGERPGFVAAFLKRKAKGQS